MGNKEIETKGGISDLLTTVAIPFLLNKMGENLIFNEPRYNLKRECEKFYDYVKKRKCIDFDKLTVREGLQWGFTKCDDISIDNVFIVPQWIIPMIPDEHNVFIKLNGGLVPFSKKLAIAMQGRLSLKIRMILSTGDDNDEKTDCVLNNSLTSIAIPFILSKLHETFIINKSDSDISHGYEMFYDYIKERECIDFNKITIKEGEQLGFTKWYWDDREDVYIIPIWLLPIIPENHPVIIKPGSETVPFSKEILKKYNRSNIVIGMKLNKEGVEKMYINEVKTNKITTCDKCCHESVCQHKNATMKAVQEKVEEIRKELNPLSPIKINVTCNSFKEEKDKFSDYGLGWNFR